MDKVTNAINGKISVTDLSWNTRKINIDSKTTIERISNIILGKELIIFI